MGKTRLVAGADLGGTKILSIVMTEEGEVLASDRRTSQAARGKDAVLDRLDASLREAIRQAGAGVSDVSALGVSAPGPVDFERGIVTRPPNLPGWRDVPVARILSERLGVPAILENDANAAAFAEWRFGAGVGCRHMLFITISTGIGGGIIIDGSIYRGASGGAGEIGHMVLEENGPKCGCGGYGCLEQLASGTAIAREGALAVEQGRAPILARLASGKTVDARLVYRAAKEGDADARALIEQAGRYFGLGLTGLINVFDPEVIVIGGGLMNLGDMYLAPAQAEARKRAFAQNFADAQIKTAKLGDAAGAIGAAALALAAAK